MSDTQYAIVGSDGDEASVWGGTTPERFSTYEAAEKVAAGLRESTGWTMMQVQVIEVHPDCIDRSKEATDA